MHVAGWRCGQRCSPGRTLSLVPKVAGAQATQISRREKLSSSRQRHKVDAEWISPSKATGEGEDWLGEATAVCPLQASSCPSVAGAGAAAEKAGGALVARPPPRHLPPPTTSPLLTGSPRTMALGLPWAGADGVTRLEHEPQATRPGRTQGCEPGGGVGSWVSPAHSRKVRERQKGLEGESTRRGHWKAHCPLRVDLGRVLARGPGQD